MPKAPPKAKTLTDEVVAAAKAISRGPRPWYERLPDPVKSEVLAMRESFLSGSLGITQTAMAKSLEQALRARGIDCPKWGEITRWLAR
jgi:hypothetical protein